AFIYSPTDLSQTTPALFFTRWISHFCAPVFMFLAGTSAFLSGQRKTKKELSAFLFTRGLWLMFVDVVIMTFGWNFDITYHVVIFNVIWAFGVSMLIMALLIHLPLRIIFVIGLLLVFGHHLLDDINVDGNNVAAFLWALVHKQQVFHFGGRTVLAAYAFIPWVGVMALGYCLGHLYTDNFTPARRKKILLLAGTSAILLFIVLRYGNVYGDPSPWQHQSSATYSFLSFLNVSKYPPSLLFLLMTLGPALVFLAVTEKMQGKLVDSVSIYGKVPFFYYIIHVYFIHLLALIVIGLFPGFTSSDMILKQPLWMADHVKGYGFSLAVVYLIWLAVVIALYPLCKWYYNYKLNHKQNKWLSYI
ncbi:MAG TPA: heparan-alpha-glucosaminide N-acetyltransferase domain-containing protein, partial [Chitinophagaceae bacterium]